MEQETPSELADGAITAAVVAVALLVAGTAELAVDGMPAWLVPTLFGAALVAYGSLTGPGRRSGGGVFFAASLTLPLLAAAAVAAAALHEPTGTLLVAVLVSGPTFLEAADAWLAATTLMAWIELLFVMVAVLLVRTFLLEPILFRLGRGES